MITSEIVSRALLAAATPRPWPPAGWHFDRLDFIRHLVKSTHGSGPYPDVELILAAVNAYSALLDLRDAAIRISDKRTAENDGFWVSAREMRYLDAALEATNATAETIRPGITA